MTTARTLDFLVIGAQKAGTTALHHYLQGTPGVVLPRDKEVPFFMPGRAVARDWPAFVTSHFDHARPADRIGKVTPHYMVHGDAPAQIASVMPKVRLIAVLRDPVQRAFSHYRMMRRRGWETRSFADAVREQLEPGSLQLARELEMSSDVELHGYVAWGEYGRQLLRFLEHFPRGQLLLIGSNELEADPERCLRRVFEHIGVAEPALPEQVLSERLHVGDQEEKVARLKRLPVLSRAWQTLPERIRAKLRTPLRRLAVLTPARPGEEMAHDTERTLRAFFAEDSRLLREAFDWEPPWEGSRGAGRAEHASG